MLSALARPSAPRNRLGAGACALAGTAALAAIGGQDRAALQYAVVLTAGYGHLLGGALPSIRKLASARRGQHPASAARALAGVAALGGIYAGYLAAAGAWPAFILLLLAVSTLHTVENDWALGEAYAGNLRLPALSARGPAVLTAAGFTALVLALATAVLAAEARGPGLPDPAGATLGLRAAAAVAGSLLMVGPAAWRAESAGLALVVGSAVEPGWVRAATGIAFSDLFCGLTLYHLASWWILSAERARAPGARPGAGQEVGAVHAVPLLVLGAGWAMGEAAGAALRSAFLAPAPYLFWSAVHVFQTAWARRGPTAAPLSRGSPRPPGLP